jgi:PAS domain S-box-containing protein/putative nucleotidyltransferase with HDIG domain
MALDEQHQVCAGEGTRSKGVEESIERYHGLFEKMLNGFALHEIIYNESGQPCDYRVLEINLAFEELTGMSAGDVVGKTLRQFLPGIEPYWIEAYNQTALTGEPVHFENYLQDLNKYFEVMAFSPQKGQLAVFFIDATKHRQTEESLRQRAEELAALQATILEIAAPFDLPTQLNIVVERAVELLRASEGGLYLCDPERKEVRCAVSYHTPADYTGVVLKYGEGAAGIVAQTGRPLVIDDYRTWSGRATVFNEDMPFSAVLSVPMICQGRLNGVIHVLEKSEFRHFSQADLELLTMFAGHAAVAVEHARLHDTAQREIAERRRTETVLARRTNEMIELYNTSLEISSQQDVPTLLNSIVRRAAGLLNVGMGGLYLLEPDGQCLKLVVGYNLPGEIIGTILKVGEGLSGLVAETGVPQMVDNYELWDKHVAVYDRFKFRRVLAVPLKIQNRIIGVINGDDDQNTTLFSEEDVRLLCLFADQAAIAVEKARLYGELQRDLEERKRAQEVQSVLYRISDAALTAQTLNELYSRIHAIVGELLPAHNFYISLYDQNAGLLHFPYHADQFDFVWPSIQPGKSLSAYVLRSGEPLLATPEVFEQLLQTGEVELVGSRMLDWLGVPLKTQGKTTGVMAVQTYSEDERLGEAEKDLLVFVSKQVAMAIERKRAEEALRESEERFSSAFEFAPIGMTLSSLEGKWLKVNRVLCELLGYAENELLEKNYQEFTHPDDLSSNLDYTRHMLNGEIETYQMEKRYIHKQGHLVWALLNVSLVRDEQGNPLYFITHIQDITDRNQRESEREAVITVSSALRVAATRSEMLPVLLDQLLALFNADGAMLSMHDLATGETITELGRGPVGVRLTGLRLPPGVGLSGMTVTTGRPYQTNDIQGDVRFALPDWPADISAAASAPLIAHEVIIGALWVARRSEFTESEVRMLVAIADMAANAIHRVTLNEQTERSLQRLTALHQIDTAISASLDLRITLNVLLDHVIMQLGADAADILLLAPYGDTLEYAAGRGFRTKSIERSSVRLGRGQAGGAALSRQILTFPDMAATPPCLRASLLMDENFVSHQIAPLVAKGQVKGVLEIFQRSRLAPDLEWLDFLETLSTQAAIAIDNAGLFERLQRSNLELSLAYDTTLEGWAHALELRDQETEGHTQRVTELTLDLAHLMGISDANLVHIRRGALLHDIGKMGVPDSILLKPGPLTPDEWEIMRRHPTYAFDMLSSIAYLRQSMDIPRYHHEKWDGTGYPYGLKGEQIPLSARIFSVVDVWDALRTDRPYRQAWGKDKAEEYIRQQSGHQFDPQVVKRFEEMLGQES